ncbi:predicted protein [Sclerotinia sclerotiorum 1980 UF-70]|uniref:Uncharacterized protein n=1 Tax=Sclerotinia sclerotiorum (strain ATCC 18683 / 1980 / Ss-1) TaxID=665079 RepID=A7EBC0_SCLS1|nr:predicted protein [Sclerotinia sclerotiorum 1980 UF-70]EDN99748.1 predicted protein [Sclerotinia sclerotiorum 1980 UF-70]
MSRPTIEPSISGRDERDFPNDAFTREEDVGLEVPYGAEIYPWFTNAQEDL